MFHQDLLHPTESSQGVKISHPKLPLHLSKPLRNPSLRPISLLKSKDVVLPYISSSTQPPADSLKTISKYFAKKATLIRRKADIAHLHQKTKYFEKLRVQTVSYRSTNLRLQGQHLISRRGLIICTKDVVLAWNHFTESMPTKDEQEEKLCDQLFEELGVRYNTNQPRDYIRLIMSFARLKSDQIHISHPKTDPNDMEGYIDYKDSSYKSKFIVDGKGLLIFCSKLLQNKSLTSIRLNPFGSLIEFSILKLFVQTLSESTLKSWSLKVSLSRKGFGNKHEYQDVFQNIDCLCMLNYSWWQKIQYMRQSSSDEYKADYDNVFQRINELSIQSSKTLVLVVQPSDYNVAVNIEPLLNSFHSLKRLFFAIGSTYRDSLIIHAENENESETPSGWTKHLESLDLDSAQEVLSLCDFPRILKARKAQRRKNHNSTKQTSKDAVEFSKTSIKSDFNSPTKNTRLNSQSLQNNMGDDIWDDEDETEEHEDASDHDNEYGIIEGSGDYRFITCEDCPCEIAGDIKHLCSTQKFFSSLLTRLWNDYADYADLRSIRINDQNPGLHTKGITPADDTQDCVYDLGGMTTIEHASLVVLKDYFQNIFPTLINLKKLELTFVYGNGERWSGLTEDFHFEKLPQLVELGISIVLDVSCLFQDIGKTASEFLRTMEIGLMSLSKLTNLEVFELKNELNEEMDLVAFLNILKLLLDLKKLRRLAFQSMIQSHENLNLNRTDGWSISTEADIDQTVELLARKAILANDELEEIMIKKKDTAYVKYKKMSQLCINSNKIWLH